MLDSSTVTTPSLPTLSIASAMTSPMDWSAAEMAATWAISDFSSISLAEDLMESTAAATAVSDAALHAHRVGTGGDVAQTLAHQRLGQHRGGGGAVTGDVVGLGRDFLDQLGAHVLEGVVELDLAAMDTPSLVMVGAPNFLSSTTLRPLGPMVTLTASASLLTPASRERRASSSNFRIFDMCSLLVRVSSVGRDGSGRHLMVARMSRPARMRTSSPSTAISVPPYLE